MDKKLFEQYTKFFLRENSKLNLISKNDEKYIWEKHIFDSLSIEKFFEKYNITDLSDKQLLDIGTGGGFPAVPAAIRYPELQVTALDSIHKKINAICEIKENLKLDNLYPVCKRAEALTGIEFDFITSRAVAELKILVPYAIPLLKKDGYFIAYKSVKVQEEIDNAQAILKKYNTKVIDIIEYQLPLNENFTRNLVILKR